MLGDGPCRQRPTDEHQCQRSEQVAGIVDVAGARATAISTRSERGRNGKAMSTGMGKASIRTSVTTEHAEPAVVGEQPLGEVETGPDETMPGGAAVQVGNDRGPAVGRTAR